MRVSDRERTVLVRDLCRRLGAWGANDTMNTTSQMDSIQADAERLVEVLNACELSLYRKRFGPVPLNDSEEG